LIAAASPASYWAGSDGSLPAQFVVRDASSFLT
jgi:hypothetical protein